MRVPLQLALALVCASALVAIAHWIVRRESLVRANLAPLPLQNQMLLRKRAAGTFVIGTNRDTHPSKVDRVFHLRSSQNRAGGEQFTLSFRLAMVDPTIPTRKCVLLWGDPNYVPFETANGTKIKHLLTFMPMIWISPVFDAETGALVDHELSVFYNTSNSIRNVCKSRIRFPGSAKQSITDIAKGVRVTVTFSDFDANDTSVGCVCRMYLNEHMVADTPSLGETIKRNTGLLYVLPTLGRGTGISTNDLEGGNNVRSNCTVDALSYHNYALTVRDVARIETLVFEADPSHVETKSGTYDATQDMAYQYLRAAPLA